jgi:mRNA interferase RelE/StbE
MEITPLSDFQIAETKTFQKEKNKLDAKFYKKIKDIVYPQLKQNPFFGNNIKKLKGEFEGVYRYRFGNYRLFYTIEKEKIIVAILDIKHRQKAYD